LKFLQGGLEEGGQRACVRRCGFWRKKAVGFGGFG